MTITETPNENPSPAPVHRQPSSPSRWPLPVLICLASLIFCVAAGLAACEVDEAAGRIDSEEIDSQDDASIRSCDVDDATGAVTAALSVTNDSSGLSSYIVEVEFTDGAGSRVGGSTIFLDEVEPDATEEREVDRDVDGRSGVTCHIDHVERFAA
jgi:hypothetical protein